MLWYKGWLETRVRVIFLLGFLALLFGLLGWAGRAGTPSNHTAGVLTSLTTQVPLVVIIVCAVLGAAGVATQPSLGVTKGLHGSTLFTLSLPVSRPRLLITRAAIGWFEAVGIVALLFCGMWWIFPTLKLVTTPIAWIQYGLTTAVCASAIYFVAVLLGSFLDDQWRTWGTMMVAGALAAASRMFRLPAFVDIFRAMTKASPLIAHAIPWGPMGFSLVLAVILFLVTLKIVQTREY